MCRDGVWGIERFQSTRLSRASTNNGKQLHRLHRISIHKALASLDADGHLNFDTKVDISIHKALASLDIMTCTIVAGMTDFNPQGSREPRRREPERLSHRPFISIHKALASLDGYVPSPAAGAQDFNPQGSREPRLDWHAGARPSHHFNPQGSREPRHNLSAQCHIIVDISIHKALASLDSHT